MRRIVVLALGVLMAITMAAPALAGGRPLTADLSGANEVPPVDSGGSGTMELTLNQGQGEICFDLDIEGIATPTRAHIHEGVAGQNGGVVVFFFDQVVDPTDEVVFEGCVDGIEKDLIKKIRQNPSGYYINIHNAVYPGGALRGQLSK